MTDNLPNLNRFERLYTQPFDLTSDLTPAEAAEQMQQAVSAYTVTARTGVRLKFEERDADLRYRFEAEYQQTISEDNDVTTNRAVGIIYQDEAGGTRVRGVVTLHFGRVLVYLLIAPVLFVGFVLAVSGGSLTALWRASGWIVLATTLLVGFVILLIVPFALRNRRRLLDFIANGVGAARNIGDVN